MSALPPHHPELLAAYGFGLFPLPTYRPAELGDWRVRIHLPSRGDGYLATQALESRAVLTRAGKVWMSTGLLEQESHAWHVHCARGTVVVAGLGLGMYAYAAAMKPEVERVIVADLSPEIIALMRAATDFDRWPCRDKVTLLEADALSEDFARGVEDANDGRPIDYLYADIWPNFPADEAPAQTAAMVRRLQPKAAGWCGPGTGLGLRLRRARGAALDTAALEAWFAELSIPLPPVEAGYVASAAPSVRLPRLRLPALAVGEDEGQNRGLESPSLAPCSPAGGRMEWRSPARGMKKAAPRAAF